LEEDQLTPLQNLQLLEVLLLLNQALSNNNFSALTLAAAVYVPPEDKIYQFGGFNSIEWITDSIWMFDIATLNWTQLNVSNTTQSPSPRIGHAVAYSSISHKIYLYGGQSQLHHINLQDPYLNDFWEFDLTSLSWKELDSKGTMLPAIGDFVMVSVDLPPSIIIHGGCQEVVVKANRVACINESSLVLRYNILEAVWTISDSNIALIGHSATSFQNRIYIFGGSKEGYFLNSTLSIYIGRLSQDFQPNVGILGVDWGYSLTVISMTTGILMLVFTVFFLYRKYKARKSAEAPIEINIEVPYKKEKENV